MRTRDEHVHACIVYSRMWRLRYCSRSRNATKTRTTRRSILEYLRYIEPQLRAILVLGTIVDRKRTITRYLLEEESVRSRAFLRNRFQCLNALSKAPERRFQLISIYLWSQIRIRMHRNRIVERRLEAPDTILTSPASPRITKPSCTVNKTIRDDTKPSLRPRKRFALPQRTLDTGL